MLAIGMAGGNADASAQAGREVLIGGDALSQVLEDSTGQARRKHVRLRPCCIRDGGRIAPVFDAATATRLVASALEQMIQAYAVSRLEEGLVVGSVWEDFVVLRNAAEAGDWDDQTPITGNVLGELWPQGTPPGWPA